MQFIHVDQVKFGTKQIPLLVYSYQKYLDRQRELDDFENEQQEIPPKRALICFHGNAEDASMLLPFYYSLREQLKTA
jgi:hypothetical protein